MFILLLLMSCILMIFVLRNGGIPVKCIIISKIGFIYHP